MTSKVFDFVMGKYAEWRNTIPNYKVYHSTFCTLVNTACYWCKEGLNDDEVIMRLNYTFFAV